MSDDVRNTTTPDRLGTARKVMKVEALKLNIADVLYAHEWDYNGDGKCRCGWETTAGDYVDHLADCLVEDFDIAPKAGG